MKVTIGILGGMGPYATLAFYKSLLDAMPATRESDLFHVIIDSNPKIPSRTRAFLFNETSPVPDMIAAARRLLDAGTNILTLPCNSAHYFLPEIERKLGVKFMNIIEETSRYVLKQGYGKIGILAGEVTVQAKLYESELNPHGIEVLQVSAKEQQQVRTIIEDVKNNHISRQTISSLKKLLESLLGADCQSVILGCTELGTVMGQINESSYPSVDSVECLAKATVSSALSLSR